MASGLDYCVKVHVNLADLSKYAIDQIGIHFSDEKLIIEKKGILFLIIKLNFQQYFLMKKLKSINQDINGKLFVEFIMQKEKRYITIGNFYNNKDTQYEKLAKIDTFQELNYQKHITMLIRSKLI